MKKIRLSLFGLILCISAVLHAARPVRGYYEVPVSSSELSAFAKFPVKFKADNYEAFPNVIEFPMPQELTGNLETVRLEKVSPVSNVWQGPKGAGNCEIMDKYFSCRIEFSALPIDSVKAAEVIQQKFTDPLEMQGKLSVSEQFGDQPIGIIKYKLSGSQRRGRDK
jgi:hypothetical protein